jgi:putative Mg2+ transporter-C (MgtC) family protein
MASKPNRGLHPSRRERPFPNADEPALQIRPVEHVSQPVGKGRLMPTLDVAEAFLRIGAGAGCGALIGLERESRNQLAGMRTHALVAAGAAVFTLAGAHGFPDLARGPNVDPMRVAAQIASGIGFIGAGAIIRDRGSVRGVTTAAALWTSAALGLAAGAGLWWVAVAGAVVTLLVLVGLRPVSAHVLTPFATRLRTIDVEYQKGHGTIGPLFEAIREAGAELDDLHIRDSDHGATRSVAVDVRVRDPGDLDDVTSALGALPEVERCAIRRTPDYRDSSSNGRP